jgi:hypothetical protein
MHGRVNPLHTPSNISWTLPQTSTWVRGKFIRTHNLLAWNQSSTYLSVLDNFVILSWILDELSQAAPSLDKFVLQHPDLGLQNVLVDREHNLVGYNS